MRIFRGLVVPRTDFKNSVYEKQSQFKGTQSRLPVIVTAEQYLAEHTHTHTSKLATPHNRKS